jgi:hypothetical protein
MLSPGVKVNKRSKIYQSHELYWDMPPAKSFREHPGKSVKSDEVKDELNRYNSPKQPTES